MAGRIKSFICVFLIDNARPDQPFVGRLKPLYISFPYW